MSRAAEARVTDNAQDARDIDVTDSGQAETASKESESCFRALCERSLAGIYLVQDGRLKYANAAMAELLGCAPEELCNVSPLDFIHPDDRALAQENMRRRLAGEAETSKYEVRYVRKDGNVSYVEELITRD